MDRTKPNLNSLKEEKNETRTFRRDHDGRAHTARRVRAGSNRYAGARACSANQGTCRRAACDASSARRCPRVYVSRVDCCQDRAR